MACTLQNNLQESIVVKIVYTCYTAVNNEYNVMLIECFWLFLIPGMTSDCKWFLCKNFN